MTASKGEFGSSMYRDILKKLTCAFASLKGRWTKIDHYRPDFGMLDQATVKINEGQVTGACECLLDMLSKSKNFGLLLSEETVRQYPEVSIKRGWQNTPSADGSSDKHISIAVYDTSIQLGEKFFQQLEDLGQERQDILYVLRPHRFGFLPKWVFGLLTSSGSINQINNFVEQWMDFASDDENSYAYYSNLLVVQRVIALCWSLRVLMLMDREKGALEKNLVKILVADLAFLRTRLGQSVANNHLLIDYFGGWFVEFVLADLIKLDNWGSYEDRWLSEWHRQVYDDGAGFEHATHYHELVCEMTAIYVILKQRGLHIVQDSAISRLRHMLKFQLSLTGPNGLPFHLGNATEDPMFPFCETPGWVPGALRELYRSLFDSSVIGACVHDSSVEKAYWLLDGKLALESASEKTEKTELVSFSCGGVHVLESGHGGDRIIFRTGPKSNQEIHAGHAHADLNAVYMTDNGKPIWVDSGTYTYKFHSSDHNVNWKKYFASPQSHNCLTIDDKDPLGGILGDFRAAKQSCFVRDTIVFQDKGFMWVEGEIEADNSYAGSRRGIIFVDDEYWIIYDRIKLTDKTPVRAELRFQCADGCKVSQGGDQLVIVSGKEATSLQVGRNIELLETLCGSNQPLGGWLSESYGVLDRAPQIRMAVKDVAIPTLIIGKFSSQSLRMIQLEETYDDDVYVAKITTQDCEDRLVISLSSDVRDMSPYVGIETDSPMIWMRRNSGIVEKVYAAQGRDLSQEQRCGKYIGVSRIYM